MNATANYISELSAYVEKMRARFETLKFYCGLVHLLALSEIVADVRAAWCNVGAKAHAARVADDEAAAILRTVLADRKVTANEIPMLDTALANVSRSARLDHDISDEARA